ncbi:hypothetical protein NK718_02815 [Alsobacter sp. SYSU M60028]|uniref:Uncharacterized protein n=1 Tax=Alsobacter ponti TaxID=2962936 RepID=A0ABT1L7J1_9HYPH|nr:hypothetical protein [Alsobacter ponti]MCP8937435.1 hypothetical protein [Alsobacter ponti]
MNVASLAAIRRFGMRPRRLVALAVTAGVLIVLAANAHLVYVAVTSQPDCVAHTIDMAAPGSPALRAAESGCSPPSP